MGWKASVRSAQAAARRAKREESNRQKQGERAAASRRKELLSQTNANEVEVYENYMEVLKSVHTDCSDAWEWEEVAAKPNPRAPVATRDTEMAARAAYESFRSTLVAPVRNNAREVMARAEESGYAPGFFERILGQDAARRASLVRAINDAVAEDEADYARDSHAYQHALAAEVRHHVELTQNIEVGRAHDEARNRAAAEKHAAQVEEREWFRRLAAAVLRRDSQAFGAALEHLVSFDELEELGSRISVRDVRPEGVTIECEVADTEVVPTEELSLGSSGAKVNRKKLTDAKRQDIYQDHVCSCALRIGREVFALLPVDRVVVNVGAATLDTSTGHPVLTTFLAVHFTRGKLSKLNFTAIDPSDSMRNFEHRMTFKKSAGFSKVEPISLDEQWAGEA